jgi:hypothetical protein
MRIRLRRRLPILVGLLLVIAAVLLVVQLRRHAPPEPARLLPSGDAFIYVNLGWIRRVNAVDQLPPVSHDPEYEKFIEATGFQFERDLDRAAFAVHYPPSRGGTPAQTPQPRFSEVLQGRVQTDKLVSYLKSVARSVDEYRGVEIFNIPLENRTLRVAVLSVDTVAASNQDDPLVIRGIVDRSRKLASPFAGPAFLRQYYKEIPLASLAWGVVRVDNSNAGLPLANGLWSMLLPKQSVVVLSARFLRSLNFRAEAIASNEEDAHRITEQAGTFLDIFHTAESSASARGSDPDVKEFFDSLKVEQRGKRAVLTATLPPGFIRKIFTAPEEAANGSKKEPSAPAILFHRFCHEVKFLKHAQQPRICFLRL